MLYAVLLVSACLACTHAQYKSAVCDMRPNPSFNLTHPLYQNIRGTVTFIQKERDGPVDLYISLMGFNRTDGQMRHGFHIHESGDIKNGCEWAGPHFNPYGTAHGGPGMKERHVGDLGNIEEDASGAVITKITDDFIKFEGEADITRRTLDIHETFDDLGLGGFPDSPTGGHSGKRLACCVVQVIAKAKKPIQSKATPLVGGVMMTSWMLLVSMTSLLRHD